MQILVICVLVLLAAPEAVFGEECDYTMERMCSLTPNAKFTTRGCWYYCRIKADFEVFTGTLLDGEPCKSISNGVVGVCQHGLCFPVD